MYFNSFNCICGLFRDYSKNTFFYAYTLRCSVHLSLKYTLLQIIYIILLILIVAWMNYCRFHKAFVNFEKRVSMRRFCLLVHVVYCSFTSLRKTYSNKLIPCFLFLLLFEYILFNIEKTLYNFNIMSVLIIILIFIW